MAELTIRFRHNPRTGKRDLIIGYESDQDALPHEHERDHRALVEALLGQTLTDGIGEIHVERVAPPAASGTDEPGMARGVPSREAKRTSE
jgi:hypothetical protein